MKLFVLKFQRRDVGPSLVEFVCDVVQLGLVHIYSRHLGKIKNYIFNEFDDLQIEYSLFAFLKKTERGGQFWMIRHESVIRSSNVK